MKLFKLRSIAFSYSEQVGLYCSDKGETLHIHNFHIHFRLHSHQKWLTVYSNPGLCTLSCAAFVDYQIRDTVASFPIGTKYARSEIWYRIWKTLNFYKLYITLPVYPIVKKYDCFDLQLYQFNLNFSFSDRMA